MEINNLLGILNKVSKILKVYANSNMTLEEILDNIYEKIKSTNFSKIEKEPFEANKVIDKIKYMEKSEIVQLLDAYKKGELIEIINKIGLKVSKSQKNETIIETIANYYSFKNLSSDMSNRDMNPNKFFEGQSDPNEIAVSAVSKNS